jgi:hypothetical protein
VALWYDAPYPSTLCPLPTLFPLFVHDMQRVEFKVVGVIKPGTEKIIETQVYAPGKR